VLGVVNLRGKVVPVVDLGLRLQLSIKERDNKSRLIVVEVGDSVVGFTVDAVSEVLRVPQDSIEPTTSQETYIVGVATVDEQIMTMLDLENLLNEAIENGTLSL
jgi:purine-binding chemotaxis protein CheW